MNSDAEIKSGIIRQCMDLGIYTAEQFLVDKNCMCKEYQTDCSKCPMGKMLGHPDVDCCACTAFIRNNPCKAVSIVRNYAIKGVLPPIELKEVKHAHWVDGNAHIEWFVDAVTHNLNHRYKIYCKCSDCNYEERDKTNYCPNCSAEMDGEGET